MRLNYWVIHYVWIFLLGAVCAERYETVCDYMWRYRYLLGASAVGSVLFDAWVLLLCYGRMALHCTRSYLYSTSNESDGRSVHGSGHDV